MRRFVFIVFSALMASSALEAAVEFAPADQLPGGGVLVLPVDEAMQLPAQLAAGTAEGIGRAAEAAEFDATAGNALSLYAMGSYTQVLLIGVGDEGLGAREMEELGGRIATASRGIKEPVHVVADVPDSGVNSATHIALGLELGSYHFDKYLTTEDEQAPGKAADYVLYSATPDADKKQWASNSSAIVDGVLFARDLISEPASAVYPESFVARTRAAFKGVKNTRIRALDMDEMTRLGMGALVGVGMGSERPPRLLIVEYRGAGDDQPIVFAGKGVTFDSGGISLKRSSGMWKMKYDMSGAAAVTGTVLTLAKRGAAVNAVAIAALVENMPSQRAQRPGDVRTTGSGKTIEVINTDAEGRLILSDAVWYAQENYDPALLVDVATLTGSVRTALGLVYGGLFTRHDELAETFLEAGTASGEEVWRLPLHGAFRSQIKSDIADIKNTGVSTAGGGASVGAEVIGTFVEDDTPWVHLDIAGTAWATKDYPMVPKGAAGWGVRLLNQLVADHYEP